MARSLSRKSRSYTTGGGMMGTRYSGTGSISYDYERTYSNYEWIDSCNHKGPPYRSGGPMLLMRDRTTHTLSGQYFGAVSNPGYSLKNAYSGKFEVGFVPNAISLPTRNLQSLGTEAISRTIPTNPSSSMAQYLAELKDLPGMIKQTQTFFEKLARGKVQLTKGRKTVGDALDHFADPRATAGDYLNLQFGWVPLIKDLQSFYKTGKNIDKRIAFLKRNLKKPVHRSRVLEQWEYSTIAESASFDTLSPTLRPVLHTFLYGAGSQRSTRDRVVKQYGKIWFEASYTYYSPEIEKATRWDLVRDAYGLRLDAELIYQLTPWSWLIDWFSTTGAVVHNTVEMAKHHVVLNHGYVMSHMYSKHDVKCTQKMRTGLGANNSSPTQVYTASASRLFETKQRVAANPYGFGVNFDGFSPYQISILAALGISRRNHDQ